jgi:acyl carrier protein
MPVDATQLGLEGTMDVVRDLLVERFGLTHDRDAITPDEPLFSVGVGLSSLEGMELLVELEKRFGIEIKNVDWWVYETPTLSTLAQYVLELSTERQDRNGDAVVGYVRGSALGRAAFALRRTGAAAAGSGPLVTAAA